ncbi:MAG: hypothetical protein WHS82_00595 [Candidatus Methanosuratincola sp.]
MIKRTPPDLAEIFAGVDALVSHLEKLDVKALEELVACLASVLDTAESEVLELVRHLRSASQDRDKER